tara:strand:- start:146 stop:376 length:231 start_codon:yes stop_codon:yes gene_type:complete
MVDKKIINALNKVFPKNKLPKNIDNLKIGSFKTWDSLAHLNFLLIIEKQFKIKFSINEMTTLKKIKDIKKKIQSKI